jgi:hypothetical protein
LPATNLPATNLPATNLPGRGRGVRLTDAVRLAQ